MSGTVDRKEQLINRVRELMSDESVVVKKMVPEYETRTFEASSRKEIEEDITFYSSWRPTGYRIVESLSYSTYVKQKPLVDYWTNEVMHTAIVIFRVIRFREDVVEELRAINTELTRCLGFSNEPGTRACEKAILEALDL